METCTLQETIVFLQRVATNLHSLVGNFLLISKLEAFLLDTYKSNHSLISGTFFLQDTLNSANLHAPGILGGHMLIFCGAGRSKRSLIVGFFLQGTKYVRFCF